MALQLGRGGRGSVQRGQDGDFLGGGGRGEGEDKAGRRGRGGGL